MDRLIYYLPLFLLAVLWLFQLYYQFFVFRKLSKYPVHPFQKENDLFPLSVIICSRNQEKDLSESLPFILEQDYPDYEVIVVNDCSSDDSEWLLKKMAEKFPRLSVVNIKEHPRYKHGKKFALTIGIKAAKNKRLVFTDATCRPASHQWLTYMASAFQPGVEIVLGYAPYTKQTGLLNKLIRFENFYSVMRYLSYSLKNRAYMGVGRNMAYAKELFFKGKGFASHMHIAYGEDVLFVNQNASSTNTAICIHPDAQVWCEPVQSFREKRKHRFQELEISKAFKQKHKRRLNTQFFSTVLFYFSLVVSAFLYPQFLEFILAVYGLHLLVQVWIYWRIMKKLQVLDLIAYLPILEIVYYFTACFYGFIFLFTKKKP